MELSEYLLKLLISLVVVVFLAVIVLPLLLRRAMGLGNFKGRGSFEIRKVSAIAKNTFIVELAIKGKTYVLCVSDKGADVIYREDDKGSPDSASGNKGSDGSRADNPAR